MVHTLIDGEQVIFPKILPSFILRSSKVVSPRILKFSPSGRLKDICDIGMGVVVILAIVFTCSDGHEPQGLIEIFARVR